MNVLRRSLLRGGGAVAAIGLSYQLSAARADCAVAPAPKSLAAKHPASVIVKKSSEEKPEITLEYFCLQGLGELPRLILEATGLDYTSVFHYSGSPSWREYATFGQLPVLRDGPLLLVESSAICRHLARRACIDGASLEDKAKVDMYCELAKDMAGKRSAIYDVEGHADGPKLKQFLKAAEDACDGSYFVGGSMTLADITLFHQLHWFEQVQPGSLSAYPKLSSFVSAFAAQPNIAAYLASPRRVPLTSNEMGKGHTGLPGYEFTKPLRVATYATAWEGP